MGRPSLSLWDFLERNVIRTDNDAQLASFREQLDKSELLVMMEHLAAEVNESAGGLVIDVQTYLPPEPLVRSFSFQKGDKDYTLQLESWGPNPGLTFIMRQWRGPLLLSSFGWILRLLGVQEYVMVVKFRSPISAEEATHADVEKWFMYLISGFNRQFARAAPRSCLPKLSQSSRRDVASKMKIA